MQDSDHFLENLSLDMDTTMRWMASHDVGHMQEQASWILALSKLLLTNQLNLRKNTGWASLMMIEDSDVSFLHSQIF